MPSKMWATLLCLAVVAGCNSLGGINYTWDEFTPTGQVYEYEGKRYDVYQGRAIATFEDRDGYREGKVLFPQGTGRASLKTINVQAVCWDDREEDCNVSFGKQLRGPNAVVRDEGMGY